MSLPRDIREVASKLNRAAPLQFREFLQTLNSLYGETLEKMLTVETEAGVLEARGQAQMLKRLLRDFNDSLKPPASP